MAKTGVGELFLNFISLTKFINWPSNWGYDNWWVGTETTFAPQAPGADLRIGYLTFPPRPPPTALGTGTNDKIPPRQPCVEIDDPEEANPQVAQLSQLWLTFNNSYETPSISNMDSFNTGLWKTRRTLKANTLSRNNRELTCLNGLEKLIILIPELPPVEVFLSWHGDLYEGRCLQARAREDSSSRAPTNGPSTYLKRPRKNERTNKTPPPNPSQRSQETRPRDPEGGEGHAT
uniref:Uncharacterized protein n=1 Tax=Cannabis sativa TaxID=3483 RepID=A0A803PRN3_CANSA